MTKAQPAHTAAGTQKFVVADNLAAVDSSMEVDISGAVEAVATVHNPAAVGAAVLVTSACPARLAARGQPLRI